VAPVWRWLGRRGFSEVAALQERVRAELLAGAGPETLLLVEHEPVITLGRSADRAHVLFSAEALAARGVALESASRGGDVTYHGPGQLVGYPIVRLRKGVVAHVEAMAAAVIEVLAGFAITASFRRQTPGVFVEDRKPPAKVAAIGVHVHRRATVHGFAFNLDPDLEHFRLIVPCGLRDVSVTSLRQLCGAAPSPAELAPGMAEALARHLAVPFARADA